MNIIPWRRDLALEASLKLQFPETVVEGLDNILDAFLKTMRGENVGKMVVRL